MRALCCLLGLVCTLTLPAADVSSSKISGGGGKSSGARFAITSTIGQADATVQLTGSRFGLTGGFHATVIALHTPGAPELVVTASGNNVTISWDPNITGWTLQQTSAIGRSANWQNSSGANNNSLTIPMPTGRRFYRLSRP